MEVESLGSLPVGSLWWRMGDGPWTVSVVCKGTLDLTPGELRLAARQDPIATADQFVGDNRNASLYQANELVPYKPRVDVGLVGSAYVPGGGQADSVTVRFGVADFEKAVTVLGESAAGSNACAPFSTAALTYELAAGGPGTLNPVGVGAAGASVRPRLVPAAAHNLAPGTDVPTACLGPIAPHWPGRRRLLHGKPAPMMPASAGELSIPGDFDLRYFNSSPTDQQLRELAPGATLVLENLHPAHPVLRTRLPRMSPQVFVLRTDGERHEQVANIDTLWIDTQRLVATITWRAVLDIGHRTDCRKVWVVITEIGKRLTWEKLAKLVDTFGVAPGGPLAASSLERPAGAGGSRGQEPVRPGSRWPTGLSDALRPADLGQEGRDDRMGDTMAIPDRFARPRDEDTQTEVTASVLLDRFPQPGSPGNGVPAWLARAVARPELAGVPGPPTAPAPMPMPRTSAAAAAAAAAVPAPTAPASVAIGPPAVAVPPADGNGAHVPAPAPSIPAVRPPQPSLAAIAPSTEEPRHPWEDTASFPRVLSSLGKVGHARPVSRRDVVELLWFDPAASKRVRLRWRSVADELEFAPIDERHDVPNDDPEAARARHMHFGILTEGALSETSELGHVVREAISDTGRFTPPLALVAGRLQFPFDDLEILRATAAALTPIAGDDKRLKEALGNVKELLDTPLLQHSNELVDNFTKHLRSLYEQSRRTLSREYLDTSVERLLLEQRRYQKRPIFDGSWIRGLLSPMHGGEAVPCYLPETLEKKLPMMVSFRARMIVEAHIKQDQYEAHPHALKVVTLGRVLEIER